MYVIKSADGRYWSEDPELLHGLHGGYWSAYKENATVYNRLCDVPAVLPGAIATTHKRDRVEWFGFALQKLAETVPFESPPEEDKL